MSFTIYPAIDIRGGKCVRLVQGDYEQETVYGEEPVEVAKLWERAGAEWIHLVDLDGAKAGQPTNYSLIRSIARNVSVPVQVGGGIRTQEDIAAYIEAGVSRVILGTAAIEDLPFTEKVLGRYGDKIAIGLDCRGGYVATRGWLSTTDVRAVELARVLVSYGAQTFIYTDIARDGTMTGPNVDEIVGVAREAKTQVIASGGVSTFADLATLANFASEGVTGAIVGKALYTGAIDLPHALDAMKERG